MVEVEAEFALMCLADIEMDIEMGIERDIDLGIAEDIAQDIVALNIER